MVDWREILTHFLKAPGMYVTPASYSTAAAFINGVDIALDGEPLAGFREWLIPQIDGCNNLGWPSLVLELLFPDARDPSAKAKLARGQAELIGKTGQLFQRFWRERDGGGLNAIQDRYRAWLKSQEWYNEADDPEARA